MKQLIYSVAIASTLFLNGCSCWSGNCGCNDCVSDTTTASCCSGSNSW